MTAIADKPKNRIGRPPSHTRATLVTAIIDLLLELTGVKLPLRAQLKVVELRKELDHHERGSDCVPDCPICNGVLSKRSLRGSSK